MGGIYGHIHVSHSLYLLRCFGVLTASVGIGNIEYVQQKSWLQHTPILNYVHFKGFMAAILFLAISVPKPQI